MKHFPICIGRNKGSLRLPIPRIKNNTSPSGEHVTYAMHFFYTRNRTQFPSETEPQFT